MPIAAQSWLWVHTLKGIVSADLFTSSKNLTKAILSSSVVMVLTNTTLENPVVQPQTMIFDLAFQALVNIRCNRSFQLPHSLPYVRRDYSMCGVRLLNCERKFHSDYIRFSKDSCWFLELYSLYKMKSLHSWLLLYKSHLTLYQWDESYTHTLLC